ncbi:MAG TPA: multiheme c-type cytochrome, partial [Gemmatimonadaceae bacterium]|nr:multiheme c-type cytochrome [Gemmatimonadaceae bacterium]
MTKRRKPPRAGAGSSPTSPKRAGSQQPRGAGASSESARAASDRASSRRTRILALGGTVLAALLVAIVAVVAGRGGRGIASRATGAGVELPPPHEPVAASHDSVRLADFVGSEACASCHAQEYAAWKRSTHARAGGVPSPDRVIADFDGTPIRFADAVVIPATKNGVYTFTVRQPGQPDRVFRVDGVIGGGHMVGGGTQGFISRFPDGTLRFLPFDFIRKEGVWFCNTNSRSNTGYTKITPSMRLSACGDWPPVRVLGDQPRYATCQQCHGSQITIAFDSSAHAYDTHITTLAINCESCHGPGRRHIEIAKSGRIATASDIGMRSLATLSKDASLQVCFQCHALKDELKPGYLPGKSLQEFYSTKLALLGDEPLHADGRVRTFAYQQNQLYSACYRNGSMTCTSCHDPHSQQYRDVNGTPLTGRYDDRQCTSCHASKADPIEAHTHHPAASPGSRCVSCHMPYLQHPEVGHTLRYARSDHTIPIPRPAFDASIGVQNACSQCHADRSVASLEAQVEKWYGTIKPQPRLVAALVEAQRDTDPARLAQLVLQPEPDDRIAEFAGLSHYVETALHPDMPSLPDAVRDRLEALAESPDIDIKALAL